MSEFNPKILEVGEIDNIDFDIYKYKQPTEGFLDLKDMGEVTLHEPSFSVTVYDISGYINSEEVLSITIEEYGTENALYISDVWVAEDHRDQGIGTAIFQQLMTLEDDLYLYASTDAMRTVANNVGFEEITNNWFHC